MTSGRSVAVLYRIARLTAHALEQPEGSERAATEGELLDALHDLDGAEPGWRDRTPLRRTNRTTTTTRRTPMTATTYTVRPLGRAAWRSGIPTIREAAAAQSEARQRLSEGRIVVIDDTTNDVVIDQHGTPATDAVRRALEE